MSRERARASPCSSRCATAWHEAAMQLPAPADCTASQPIQNCHRKPRRWLNSPRTRSRTTAPGSALLDELEASLGEAALGASDAAADSAASAWTPPQGLGPIPARPRERARDILGGQRELISELLGERERSESSSPLCAQVPAPQSHGRLPRHLRLARWIFSRSLPNASRNQPIANSEHGSLTSWPRIGRV